MKFDWHGAVITGATVIDSDYRNTQNVRRFLLGECGPDFKFDRDLMAWVANGGAQTVGDIAAEWNRRRTHS